MPFCPNFSGTFIRRIMPALQSLPIYTDSHRGKVTKGGMTVLIEGGVDVPTLLEYPAEALHPILKQLKGWEAVSSIDLSIKFHANTI